MPPRMPTTTRIRSRLGMTAAQPELRPSHGRMPGVVDLKFLRSLQHARIGASNPRPHESHKVASVALVPRFVSAVPRRLTNRGIGPPDYDHDLPFLTRGKGVTGCFQGSFMGDVAAHFGTARPCLMLRCT